MQPKSRFVALAAAALLAALVLAGCGGGNTGKTWFNLPSVEVELNEAGQAKVAGFTLPAPVLQPAQIEQLQAANVQQLEARIGYSGVHLLANGEELPYLAWDEESTAVLQDAVRTMPGIPQANLIAGLLPQLRTYGLGAAIKLPPAGDAVDVPRWRGETTLAPAEPPADPTIGPLHLDSIAVTPEGSLAIGPLDLAALGVPVTLPPSITGLIDQLGINTFSLQTQPTGLELTANDGAFPDLRYDQERLDRALALAGTFLGDSPLLGTINSVAGQLTGADISATVNFDGEPLGPLTLENLNVRVLEDGSIEALGLPLPVGSLLPPDLINSLSAAGLGNVRLAVSDSSIALANNGQPFPRIGWTDAGEGLLGSLAPALGVSEGMVGGVLDLVGETDLAVDVALPGADPAAAPAEVAELAPVDLGDIASPIVRVQLQVDANGAVTQLGNVAASDLAGLGLPPITLPANVMQILESTGASNVQVATTPGHADIKLDGETALTLDYDVASLRQLINTLKPILNIEILNNPAIAGLVDTIFVPMIAGSTADISIALP